MGATYVTIQVGDLRGERSQTVEVMVDTGATFSTVPASLLRSVGLSPQRSESVRLGDGSIIEDEICDALVRVEGKTFVTPITFGRAGEPNLLGLVALETALLAVDPVEQRLISTVGWKA
jgi:predicted aspartyl protease